MTPQQLLRLSDKVIAELYSSWSEHYYCAGWLSGGEEEFVKFILDFEPNLESERLADYQVDAIAKIRNLVANHE